VPPSRIAYLEVADKLREQILTGKLVAGARLPSEAELCEQFGVSRSTIREALRMLSSRHLLTTSRGVGGGSQVAHIDHDDVSQLLQDFIVLLTQSAGVSLAELMEARDLLEVPAARLAAGRRTDEQLAELRAAIPHSPDLRDIFELNRRFHHVLLQVAGNRLLTIVTEPMFYVMQTRFLSHRATMASWERIREDHAAILVAVEAGDGERAGDEMAAHLVRLRETYRTYETTEEALATQAAD
jgi:GntR family transcriptional regulator, transcriptional repressor for pyruvate dehydrogenase complex